MVRYKTGSVIKYLYKPSFIAIFREYQVNKYDAVVFIGMLPAIQQIMTLYEEYISGWESFEPDLQIFNNQTRQKILNKLKREKNRMNFLSQITEIRFGLFYAQNGANVEYEKKHKILNKEQEPDWTISLNDQIFIGEVLRLNPTQKDQTRNDFGDQLVNKIKQIKGSYYLQIDYKNQYFQPSEYDLNLMIKELVMWFSEKRSLSDQITLNNNFTFTVVKINSNHNNILSCGNFNSIDIDKRRLESSNSEFYKKIDKYAELIEYTKMPFVINVYIDFVNGIDEDDVFSFFYGKTVDDRIINSEYTDLTTGLFYSNINATKYLSGVMLRYHNTHTYFHNYCRENKLNTANQRFLLNLNRK